MNHAQMFPRIVEWAQAGGAMPLDEAMAALAAVIDHLDMYSDTYESDRVALLSVGAAIWQLRRAQP